MYLYYKDGIRELFLPRNFLFYSSLCHFAPSRDNFFGFFSKKTTLKHLKASLIEPFSLPSKKAFDFTDESVKFITK